jgi:site-specific recombinase XerD
MGKGNKERTVFLDAVTAMLLRDYLAQRTDDFPALFVGRGSSRLSANGIRKMLAVVSAAAGVEHVHPHKFRRTLATSLIRHGMPIQEVAAILGHDKLDTTMQYVVLDKTDVKNAYRRYA